MTAYIVRKPSPRESEVIKIWPLRRSAGTLYNDYMISNNRANHALTAEAEGTAGGGIALDLSDPFFVAVAVGLAALLASTLSPSVFGFFFFFSRPERSVVHVKRCKTTHLLRLHSAHYP